MAIYKPRRPRQYHVYEAISEWNKQLSALSSTNARVVQALLNEVYDRLVEKYKNEWAGGRRLTDQLRRPNRAVKFK